ncbi:MAG: BlaI/MecI/CopY family transcriptional regulator, partial [Armatimonadetes bacterium]|nr:BlaI/MecI/CopY family transcriptional regulator [Armatimonadota bacterium]
IMWEKGLVSREEAGRAHTYRPCLTAEQSQRHLVTDLLDRAFGGSAQKLVMQALSARPASREELAEIRELLDRLEKGGEE